MMKEGMTDGENHNKEFKSIWNLMLVARNYVTNIMSHVNDEGRNEIKNVAEGNSRRTFAEKEKKFQKQSPNFYD